MSDDSAHPQKGREAVEHSKSEVLLPKVQRKPAVRASYAEAIEEAYRDTLEGILRMGDLLNEAKDELSYGEYGSMVEEDLPFGKRTARKLRAIARDDRIRNRTHASDLPTAWTTLYRMTKLDDRQWAAIEPHISPDLTRSDIPELLSQGAQLSFMTAEGGQTAREELEEAHLALPRRDRRWANQKLRGIPLLERVRVTKALAALDQEERDRLIELDQVETPPKDDPEAEDLQLVLPGVAATQREELLEWHEHRPHFGSRTAEGARSALVLQTVLRWVTPFCYRTKASSVLDGLPVVRSRQKLKRNARRVANWMTRLVEKIENEEAGDE